MYIDDNKHALSNLFLPMGENGRCLKAMSIPCCLFIYLFILVIVKVKSYFGNVHIY